MKLRTTTIREIEEMLDNSYFTKESFSIENKPKDSPFLVITFLPLNNFIYSVKNSGYGKTGYISTESPGIHMESPENYKRDDFDSVKSEIRKWVARIKDDLNSGHDQYQEIDDQLEKLRENFKTHENDTGKFTSEEIEAILEKLNVLEETVVSQAETIQASEKEIEKFKSELNSIKNDLPVYTKDVWYKVAGNKVIKSVKIFMTSSEGRKLIADSIRQWLG